VSTKFAKEQLFAGLGTSPFEPQMLTAENANII
jgi:hypothetical protein